MKRTNRSKIVIDRVSEEELNKQYYNAILEKYSNLEVVSYSIINFNKKDEYDDDVTEFVVLFKFENVYSKIDVTILMKKMRDAEKEELTETLLDKLYSSYEDILNNDALYNPTDIYKAFYNKYELYCQDIIKFLIEKNSTLGAL